MLDRYLITDGTKQDKINALYLLFKEEKGEYNVSFESLPYSRGGKYKRHTSTLYSIQKWQVAEFEKGFRIITSSSSNSANCPPVNIPVFYTRQGAMHHNNMIQAKIKELEKQLLFIAPETLPEKIEVLPEKQTFEGNQTHKNKKS